MKKISSERKMLMNWLIGAVVLVFCIGFSNNWGSGRQLEGAYHKIAVDSQITQDLEVINKDLKDKEIIFTAEFHGAKSNMELELKFLKYLKNQTNFKYYLCELSHGQALSLNEYLETGDLSILDGMYKEYKGTYAYTKDNYNRWVELYQYNQQFDEENQIRVVGVDVEHQDSYALEVIRSLLPSKAAPAEIEKQINFLHSGISDKDQIEGAYQDLVDQETIYREYLGERYFDIEMILRNIKNLAYVKEKDELFNVRRDAIMYQNFMDIYERLEPGIFYGQWGHNHTYQVEEGGVKWFAAALEEDKFKDKILTIAYTYNDCETISKKPDKTYGVERLDTFSGYDAKEGTKDTALLFDIQDEQSPFSSNNKYFQYLLLISESEAAQPLQE